MKKTTAAMAQQTQKRQTAHETALIHCYGQIGIAAVAAAARYQGTAKNPAYAPVSNKKMLDWASEAAA
jgi:threonine dehydrogenase-like Zn-dependent dehydrogenase